MNKSLLAILPIVAILLLNTTTALATGASDCEQELLSQFSISGVPFGGIDDQDGDGDVDQMDFSIFLNDICGDDVDANLEGSSDLTVGNNLLESNGTAVNAILAGRLVGIGF